MSNEAAERLRPVWRCLMIVGERARFDELRL